MDIEMAAPPKRPKTKFPNPYPDEKAARVHRDLSDTLRKKAADEGKKVEREAPLEEKARRKIREIEAAKPFLRRIIERIKQVEEVRIKIRRKIRS